MSSSITGWAFRIKYFKRNRIVHTCQRCISSVKYTAQLQPDIEEQIRLNGLKPRKHPGRRKLACVILPDQLINAVKNVLADSGFSREFYEDVKKYNNYLLSRRPPIGKGEYIMRSEHLLDRFVDGIDDSDMEGTQIEEIAKQVKKMMKCEVGRWKDISYDGRTCKLHLIGRLAAHYAVISSVFSEIKHSVPSFVPKTFFDFGSGVGSAMWAANNLWGNEIKEYFCVDASPEMNDLAGSLIRVSEDEKASFPESVFFRQFLPASDSVKYDLVVSAHSLLDLPSLKDVHLVIDILMKKTKGFLVFIEHGNYAGFSMVSYVRDYILYMEKLKENADASYKSDVHVIAPCPHDMPCPRVQTEKRIPCSFQTVYEPVFPHKNTGAKKESFSYVVIGKQRRTDTKSWPRIVQPVQKRTGHVRCHLCCSDGNLHQVIFTKSKNSRETYKCARKSSLGDLLPVSLSVVTKDS